MPTHLAPKRKARGSAWNSKDMMFEVWAKHWVHGVNCFKPLTQEEKKQVILDHGVYGLGLSGTFNWGGLRIRKRLDYRIYKKYRNELVQISPVKGWKICVVSVTPIFILMAARFIKNILRKVKSSLSRN